MQSVDLLSFYCLALRTSSRLGLGSLSRYINLQTNHIVGDLNMSLIFQVMSIQIGIQSVGDVLLLLLNYKHLSKLPFQAAW